MSGSLDTPLVGRSSAQGRSNRVRTTRTALGMTQAELADAVEVTRQTVVAVEAGNYAPSVYLALAIAHRLGRSVEELFGPAGAPSRPDSHPATEVRT
ncbi:transcriptional regulator, XRE family [Kineococcus radiotolerans SRS30216 = ATCC BAA-149]|uniref:Transcriptional regulator, XRE family n=1 Tax=Kineococcus radiotolerans (strain ATCC BAA-149 / DSM 14245 / SRS30216) TaxID=266940 RepID=A6W9N0_KINRD|nr:transcriptional regulator, XRE family [Kineococcus radiotolerans SRS30216 = ATCC BAA-149]